MELDFNDLLTKKQLDPSEVLVLRHRPSEQQLFKILPWLASVKPEVFNFYQRTQGRKVENQMVKARFVAAFFGHKPGKAVFVGLYEVCGSHPMPRASIDKMPAQKELFKHGMNYGLPYGGQGIQLLFDLQPVDDLAKWGGKLIVNWPPPEIAFSRWASQNRFPVEAILDESILHGAIPDWRKLVFSWDELQVIPKEWRDVLAASRGVYFILDVSDGKGYVGMAENILERWLGYAKTGHGGNKLLRKRKPRNLLFTILERVSPDMEVRDLNERERTWKIRLHTFKYGLNDNL